MVATLLCIWICAMIPSVAVSEKFIRLNLPARGLGCESFAFETPSGIFYTGLNDGRIIKYHGSVNGSWDVFAVTSPKWSQENCLESNDTIKEPICGAPFGLAYNPSNGILYAADAYYGLLSMNSSGGVGTPLATSAEGQPFTFTDALEVDPLTGLVYFTDLSGVYDLRNVFKILETKDNTGRLMKYDPQTKEVVVLMRNLSGPGGVAISNDGSFLFVSEISANRVRKFWLTGPSANTSEIVVSILRPGNVKRTRSGQFIVAGKAIISQTVVPARFTIDETGRIIDVASLGDQYGNVVVSEVQQFGTSFYCCSEFVDFIAIYGP